jgi:hypothetical protein
MRVYFCLANAVEIAYNIDVRRFAGGGFFFNIAFAVLPAAFSQGLFGSFQS